MKRGTAAKVILGKDTLMDVPAGIVHGTDVILGGKAGLLNDFGGLVLSNNLMIGKKVSRGTITTVTVRGVAPIILPDAIAGSLQAVRAFGGTEQNGTPTPDTPVDIVSNNGVLKARHQSGLPLGYTLLDYIKSTGTQYIDLGIKGNGNTKVSVEYRYHTNTSASGSGRVFGSRTTSSSIAFAIGSASGVVSATGNKVFWCYDSQSYFVVDDPTFPIGDWQTVVFSATEHTLNGVSYGRDYNVVEFETPQNLKLFGFDNNGTMGYGQVDIARCKLWDNGVLIRDLVPCKNASNVIGMYDLVSGQFFTNQGTGTFTAGNPVDDLEIYTDGTVETINAHGKNLLNLSSFVRGKYINASGVEQNGGYGYSSIIKVVPGKKYTYNATYSGESTQTRIHGYQDGVWVLQIATGSASFWPHTITIPANINGIRISCYPTPTNPQFELGETATAYEPYFDGGTATAEMLLKVGDYQDVQSIIDGVVTRNVGVKVLDGTEDWANAGTYGANSYRFILNLSAPSTDDVRALCTHIDRIIQSNTASQSNRPCIRFNTAGASIVWYEEDNTTTLAQFTQWLAGQYNAGTPVIIVYPLATPTTESVAGQTLQVTDGDNVLEITQASLSGLELEATYKSLVQLTIQEVEDANLNNNVEVTIS